MADPCNDLDDLLDSALDDFTKLDLAPTRSGPEGDGGQGKVGALPSLSSYPPASPAGVQGLGMGLPDLKSKRKGKQRVPRPLSKPSMVSEALDKLTQQTRETVKGLGSATGAGSTPIGIEGLNNESMVEEFVKQFEELAGSQDMESIVETMMHQLLSKEILQEPMKEIGERYPKWLAEHRSGMSQEDYDRYHRQYELILKLNDVYENDSGNFSKIVDLMQKMQECGQPPNEIVQELAPDLDLNSLGQLPPELMNSTSQCSIM